MSAYKGHLKVHDLYSTLPRGMSTSRTNYMSLNNKGTDEILIHDEIVCNL